MSPKNWLKTLVITLSIGLLSACSGQETDSTAAQTAEPSKTYRWKMVTTWPPGFPVLQQGAERFAGNIKVMSNGRLNIKVYAGGELIRPYKLLMLSRKAQLKWAMAVPIIGPVKSQKHNFSQPSLLV